MCFLGYRRNINTKNIPAHVCTNYNPVVICTEEHIIDVTTPRLNTPVCTTIKTGSVEWQQVDINNKWVCKTL